MNLGRVIVERLRRLRNGFRQLGLRRTFTVAVATGSLMLGAFMSMATYTLSRGYLADQRVDSALRQAYSDAALVRSGLLTSGQKVSDVLADAAPPTGTVAMIQRDGLWYSSTLNRSSSIVPPTLVRITDGGDPAAVWTRVDGAPAVAVGIPLPAADAVYYEISTATELSRTLGILWRVLAVSTAVTTLAGALLGRWASGRMFKPLNGVAIASTRIAAGELDTRLVPPRDPDLAQITTALNQMLDALTQRIDLEARFTADVAHELRSPLTTLTTTVQLMERRRDELPPTAQQALDLMSGELSRFRSMLEDLLELGRLDAGQHLELVDTELGQLAAESLASSGRPASALRIRDGGPFWAAVERHHLSRAVVNLLRNADLHGEGLTEMIVDGTDDEVFIEVHDAGPGVPEEDRERVFARFVRGGRRASRPGVGLGLSLVGETMRALGGSVTVGDSQFGGAKFTLRLPRTVGPEPEPDPEDDAAESTADSGDRPNADAPTEAIS